MNFLILLWCSLIPPPPPRNGNVGVANEKCEAWNESLMVTHPRLFFRGQHQFSWGLFYKYFSCVSLLIYNNIDATC